MLENIYLRVFFEAARNAFLFPRGSEATFFAIHSFNAIPDNALLADLNIAILATCAIVAAILMQMFNFFLGLLLKTAYNKQEPPKHFSKIGYAKGAKFFSRYGAFLLFFSWLPLFPLMVVASGFFGLRPKPAIASIAAGIIFRYGWFVVY